MTKHLYFKNIKHSEGLPLEKCGLFKSKVHRGDWAYVRLKTFIRDYV